MSKTNYEGHVYAQVTVQKELAQGVWWGRCSCGTVKPFKVAALVSGNTKSCGCLHVSRGGKSQSAEFKVWYTMKLRCEDPKHCRYRSYGGRGIKVCDRWQDFENFLTDMGPRPSGRYSIERKDNNGNYSPENCAWVPAKEQLYNKTTTIYLTHNGQTHHLKEWSEITGIPVRMLRQRWRKQGWSAEKTLTTPSPTSSC